MTAFNQSAIPSVFFGHNSTVKAWCVTGNFQISSGSQTEFDAANFVDGFNLRLDYATQTSMLSNYRGALKFSFINPLPDNKYKVFVQPYGDTAPLYPKFGHVLNSSMHPKTNESFWVRLGFITSTSSPAQTNHQRTNNQVHNIVLWQTFSTSISSVGIVVI